LPITFIILILRIILLLLAVVALVVIFTNLAPQADMNSTIQRIQNSVTTVAYAGEFEQIRTAVDEFMVLRNIRDTPEGDDLAVRLDEKINNLQLVKVYCNQEISTMQLVNENNPYKKLQEICPALKDVSFARAVNLFELI
jgi:hypothetical protein